MWFVYQNGLQRSKCSSGLHVACALFLPDPAKEINAAKLPRIIQRVLSAANRGQKQAIEKLQEYNKAVARKAKANS